MRMRHSTFPLAAAAICVAGLSTAQGTEWRSTATQSISLINAAPLGDLDPATPMRISVALALPNPAALKSLIESGRAITPEQFNSDYAPTSAAAASVASYLSAQGMSGVETTPNRLFVSASGTAAQVASAFNTKLARFSQNGATIFVNVVPASVPASLGGVVLSVLGLNNIQAVAHPRTGETQCNVSIGGACVRETYDPASFWAAYDVGAVPDATATSIAIMAEGDVSSVTKDLTAFETAMKLPQVPVTIVQVGSASSDVSGVDEWDLDTQYSSGLAGNLAQLYIYAASSLSDQDTTLEFNKWVTDHLAQIGNASFSICEVLAETDGSMAAGDQVFMQAAAQGQTMFSSTGDVGSFCAVGNPNGVPGGLPFVGYPASSPYVVGVGGTTLITNADGSYKGEVGWFAGGGGLSAFESAPHWQAGIVPTTPNGAPAAQRALPDLSMDADPNTGAIVFVGGQQLIVGGTSLSSPMAAGVWARLMSKSGNALGFASPHLYAGYGSLPASAPPSSATPLVDGFHDILAGSNGLYTALPYYDLVTGLGTFDVAAKNKVLGN